MASPRYTVNIKPEDILPDVPKVLTPKEKWNNWWHYSWKWVIVGLLLVGLLGMFIKDIMFKVESDYTVLWVSSRGLPDDVSEALSQSLASLGTDLNGDGQVLVDVTICQMTLPKPDGAASGAPNSEPTDEAAANTQVTDAYSQMAAVTFLTTDIQERDSLIILTDDPEGLQLNYQLLGSATGEMAAEEGSMKGMAVYAWEDCPVAAGFDLGQYSDMLGQYTFNSSDLLKGIYVTRRSFAPDRGMKEYQAENEALFAALTAGATPAAMVQ